jgi:hypothetical protein
LGTIPNDLLNEKSTIHRLNGIGYGGDNPNFYFNPFVITFTFDLLQKDIIQHEPQSLPFDGP